MPSTAALLIAIRVLGLIQLTLGLLSWDGLIGFPLQVHIFLGGMLMFGLFAVVYHAYRAGVSKWLIGLGVVWYCGLPILGLAHARPLFPSVFYFKISQILHLLCAVGAVGLAEIVAAQARRKTHMLPSKLLNTH